MPNPSSAARTARSNLKKASMNIEPLLEFSRPSTLNPLELLQPLPVHRTRVKADELSYQHFPRVNWYLKNGLQGTSGFLWTTLGGCWYGNIIAYLFIYIYIYICIMYSSSDSHTYVEVFYGGCEFNLVLARQGAEAPKGSPCTWFEHQIPLSDGAIQGSLRDLGGKSLWAKGVF